MVCHLSIACAYIYFPINVKYAVFARKTLPQLTWRMKIWVKQNSYLRAKIRIQGHKISVSREVQIGGLGYSEPPPEDEIRVKWHSIWALKEVCINGGNSKESIPGKGNTVDRESREHSKSSNLSKLCQGWIWKSSAIGSWEGKLGQESFYTTVVIYGWNYG